MRVVMFENKQKKKVFQSKSLISSVKHGVSGIMV